MENSEASWKKTYKMQQTTTLMKTYFPDFSLAPELNIHFIDSCIQWSVVLYLGICPNQHFGAKELPKLLFSFKYHSDDSFLSKCEFASSLRQWLLLKLLIPTKFMIVPTPLHLQQHSPCTKYYSDISCEVLKVFWPGTQSCGVLCPMLNGEDESGHMI